MTGDDQPQLLPGAHLEGGLHLFIGEGHPAGVQPHLLGLQDHFLPKIAAELIQLGRLFAHQGDVVLHPGKFSVVGHEAPERLRLVQDQLHVQAALPAALGEKAGQLRPDLRLQGPVLIAAHRVAPFHCLQKFHVFLSSVSQTAFCFACSIPQADGREKRGVTERRLPARQTGRAVPSPAPWGRPGPPGAAAGRPPAPAAPSGAVRSR